MTTHPYVYFALSILRKQPYPACVCELDDFADISYGNDCCDSLCFTIGGQSFFMWVDWVNPADREDETASRFWITTYDIELGDRGDDYLLSTDDPLDVVSWVNRMVGSDSSFNLTAENCQEVAAEVTEPDCGCGNGWSCEVCR